MEVQTTSSPKNKWRCSSSQRYLKEKAAESTTSTTTLSTSAQPLIQGKDSFYKIKNMPKKNELPSSSFPKTKLDSTSRTSPATLITPNITTSIPSFSSVRSTKSSPRRMTNLDLSADNLKGLENLTLE